MALEYFNRAYDPLFQQLERLGLSEPSDVCSRVSQISIDWRETPHAHILQADLPGVKKENVKLDIKDGVLQISGRQEPEEAVKDEGVTWHTMERPVHLCGGTRVRHIGLPEDANVDEVKASMGNGVLTVTIPKKEMKRPHVKKVEIEEVNKEGIGKKIVKSLKGIIAPGKGK
uniref:TSA: Wollemia nobilis Ref_Wollemi_Transcript_6203_1027 transcribed RNA sequence n=1 Tax=Wollemia nobilis TaxID=56998 RepID=A0A0C9S834_9CONI